MFSLLASAAFLMAADATIYLSAFGSDRNDGATPTSAVATLSRAYQLANAQSTNNANIVMAPGVIALGTPSMDAGTVTLTGAGLSGNAAIYKFDCATGDTLNLASTTMNVFGVSFDGCDKAITITGYHAFLSVGNVIFENTNTAIRVEDATATVNVTSSRFDGRAVALSQVTKFACWVALSFFNSLFNSTTSTNTVIDTVNADSGLYRVGGLAAH
jgi:hypothetical protein